MKGIFLFQLLVKVAQQLLIEMNCCTTATAYEVMMRLTVYRLVVGLLAW